MTPHPLWKEFRWKICERWKEIKDRGRIYTPATLFIDSMLFEKLSKTFYFKFLVGSLTLRDRFRLTNSIQALCSSLYICAQMYIVNQGFGTSAAKGAHVGLRYPTMQFQISETIFLLLLLF